MTLNKKNKKILDTLNALAASCRGVKCSSHAAAVVRKGEIISFGINQMKSHPFQRRFSKNENSIYFHAETHAIYNALKKLSVDDLAYCRLYVVRNMQDGSMGNSCPCIGCQKAINYFGIEETLYSDAKGDWKCL